MGPAQRLDNGLYSQANASQLRIAVAANSDGRSQNSAKLVASKSLQHRCHVASPRGRNIFSFSKSLEMFQGKPCCTFH